MKNFPILLLAVILMACSDDYFTIDEDEDDNKTSVTHFCMTEGLLKSYLKNMPELGNAMDRLEIQTQQFVSHFGKNKLQSNGSIEIPVVVHVLYHTAAQNISYEQIASQIAVLNEDFNLGNADKHKIPQVFKGRSGDIGLNFKLTKIKRKQTDRKFWLANDEMKFSAKGGLDGWDALHYLNIWVVNFEDGILGYAQYPFQLKLKPETDGIVIGYEYFGRGGAAIPPYDKGRTATHQVGHWLNLKHTWGGDDAGNDDFVHDTPKSNKPHFGCPVFPKRHSGSTDMTMNFMEYTNDACKQMFTKGQKERIMAVFHGNGPRNTLVN